MIYRAVEDKENGMGIYNAVIDEDAARFLAEISNGDARTALNAVELGVLTTDQKPGWKDTYNTGCGTAVYSKKSMYDMTSQGTTTMIQYLHL